MNRVHSLLYYMCKSYRTRMKTELASVAPRGVTTNGTGNVAALFLFCIYYPEYRVVSTLYSLLFSYMYDVCVCMYIYMSICYVVLGLSSLYIKLNRWVSSVGDLENSTADKINTRQTAWRPPVTFKYYRHFMVYFEMFVYVFFYFIYKNKNENNFFFFFQ